MCQQITWSTIDNYIVTEDLKNFCYSLISAPSISKIFFVRLELLRKGRFIFNMATILADPIFTLINSNYMRSYCIFDPDEKLITDFSHRLNRLHFTFETMFVNFKLEIVNFIQDIFCFITRI